MVHFEAWRGVWFGCGVEFEVASEEMSLETRAGPRLSGSQSMGRSLDRAAGTPGSLGGFNQCGYLSVLAF